MAEISKDLLEKLTNAGGVTQLVDLARKNGIEVPEGAENEFYEKIMALKDKDPLTEEDLENVTGGMMSMRRPNMGSSDNLKVGKNRPGGIIY